jgi:2-methylisocitrate lyase-like PEP mutase family enzyme
VERIADRVAIPLFVDADQGGGNAFAVARFARMLEKSGAAGIQIEDQQEVKPAAQPLSRPLIPTEAMVGKIKAAKDACHGSTLISARSDAATSEGVDAAIDRALSYLEAGADMIFVESLTQRSDMERLIAAIDGRAPVLHNLLRSDDEVRDAETLQQVGYSVALFPAPVLRAASKAISASLEELRTSPRIADSDGQVDWIGAADYFAAFVGR